MKPRRLVPHISVDDFRSASPPAKCSFSHLRNFKFPHLPVFLFLIVILPAAALAQQGKWQRFGWNPPTVSQRDTNGGTWTFFGSNSLTDSGIIMRPVNPVKPYGWDYPYSGYPQTGNGFDLQFHFNLDFSLHYKNGLLEGFPLYYGPWIDPRRGYRGYWWPYRADSLSRPHD